MPPFEPGDPDAEPNYDAIWRFNEEISGWTIAHDRIYRLEWTPDGNDYACIAGEADPYEHAPTIAILRSNAYLVCPPERGVIRGDPILVGLTEVRRVTLFDDSPRTHLEVVE